MAIQNDDVVLVRRGLEITRDARFSANKRLSDRHRGSAYIVSVLSTGVILLSLIPNFVELTNVGSQVLLACSVVLSVFIIFTSLLDHTSNFYHKGETLHQCARKLHSVLQKTYLIKSESSLDEDLSGINKSYQEILEDCPFNHEEVDYLSVKIKKPGLFLNRGYSTKRVTYLIQRLVDRTKYLFLSMFWLLPHIVVTGAVSYVAVMVVIGSLPTT